jgi:trehalose-6-phosphatase
MVVLAVDAHNTCLVLFPFPQVMNHDIERWARGFLEQLDRATKLGAELNYVQVSSGKTKQLLGLKSNFLHLPTAALCDTYSAAELRVILLDYDGTLIPADKTASAGCTLAPPPGVLRLLRFLSEQPNTVCFLMSGRTRSVLTEWFGELSNLGLAAEKGLFLRWPARLAQSCRFDRKPAGEEELEDIDPNASSGSNSSSSESSGESGDDEEEQKQHRASSGDSSFHGMDWECIVPLTDISWKATALEIIKSYTEQTDGSWIEDKEFAIVWHYEQADVESVIDMNETSLLRACLFS